MELNRRKLLLGGAAAATALPFALRSAPAAAEGAVDPGSFDPESPLPHKDAFFSFTGSYLDSGSQHPLSRGARASIERYLDYKTMAGDSGFQPYATRQRVLDSYARLINASPEEISFVPSTTAGENLVVQALGLPDSGGRIVTDALHFFGSFPMYAELGKRGMDVVTLRPRAGRIDLEELEQAVTPGTRLVSISSVSTFNGFEHDLAAVCEIAHRQGALVYADAIHSVGAVPFDVRATGVDFCSASAYKWLMADMGLGFLYVRADRLGDLARPWYGYHQIASFQSHVYPGDPEGEAVADYTYAESASGYFAMGTLANAVAAELDYSLGYLLEVGVERIQRHRQPLLDRLQEALPALGYPSLTPPGSRSALASFQCSDARQVLPPRFEAAGVTVTTGRNHFRVSPSVFNDMDDIERLLEALRS